MTCCSIQPEFEVLKHQSLIYKTTPEGKNSESIILDRHEFRIEKTTPNKTFWRCISKTKYNCMAKFTTYDNVVEIKRKLRHDHPPTFTGSLDECSVEIVDIKYHPLVNLGDATKSTLKNGGETVAKAKNTGVGLRKGEPEVIVMGVDSLKYSRQFLQRREQQRNRLLAARGSMGRLDSSPYIKRDKEKKDPGSTMIKRKSMQ